MYSRWTSLLEATGINAGAQGIGQTLKYKSNSIWEGGKRN